MQLAPINLTGFLLGVLGVRMRWTDVSLQTPLLTLV